MTKIKEYKSENLIIQKCLDILDNPNVQIKELNTTVYRVTVSNEYKFTIGETLLDLPGDIIFHTDKKENGMDFSDIILVLEKTNEILKSREPEKFQKALNQLGITQTKEQQKKAQRCCVQGRNIMTRIKQAIQKTLQK